ncbi:uncharacterized protein LOC128194717 isoform X3 [Vigna angularis]|uniref:uncharacterized protein LOC128194717 isoform X3 n=1 Tax=Phaseolus angularis TaxID=3914 RepID=UPI0022B3744C|nr:uncharacterized protein LOC128194717 isoform X3 [Vigna angularis]
MISLPTLLVHSQMWILTVVMQICQVEVHKAHNEYRSTSPAETNLHQPSKKTQGLFERSGKGKREGDHTSFFAECIGIHISDAYLWIKDN